MSFLKVASHCGEDRAGANLRPLARETWCAPRSVYLRSHTQERDVALPLPIPSAMGPSQLVRDSTTSA